MLSKTASSLAAIFLKLFFVLWENKQNQSVDEINDDRSALLDGFPKSWLDNKLLDLWVLFSILVGSSVLVGGVF